MREKRNGKVVDIASNGNCYSLKLDDHQYYQDLRGDFVDALKTVERGDVVSLEFEHYEEQNTRAIKQIFDITKKSTGEVEYEVDMKDQKVDFKIPYNTKLVLLKYANAKIIEQCKIERKFPNAEEYVMLLNKHMEEMYKELFIEN
ncbi:MAG: hypothetical protein ACE5RP_00130 [Nitrosopumilus sp.]